MELNEVALALASIDGRRWHGATSKHALVLAIAVETIDNRDARGGRLIPLGSRYLAELTGLEPAWTRRVLRELVDERVLILADESAGSRGRCYQVQPEVRVWRAPWRVAIAVVEFRLMLLSGRLTHHETRFAPRYGTPQTAVAVSYGAAQSGASGVQWRGANGAPAVLHGTPQIRDGERAHPLPDLSLSTTGEQPRDEEQEQKASTIVRAISRRTGKVLFGRLPGAVADAVDGLDQDQVAQLAKAVDTYDDDRHGPPILVAFVEQQADALRQGQPAPVANIRNAELEEQTRELLADQARMAEEAAPMPVGLRGRTFRPNGDVPL